MISFIIPAYNEEALLANTLVSLKNAIAQCNIDSEIIVADNNSTDSTSQIAKNHGAQVVFEKIQQISRSRNAGARVAKGDTFIFIDADTTVNEAILKSVIQELENDKVIGGGMQVKLDHEGSKIAQLGADIWSMFSYRFKLAAGCFIFCRREAFEAAGGFSEKVYASEEIWFSLQVKKYAKKHKKVFTIIKDQQVITSSRKMQWHSSFTMLFWISLYLIFPFLTRYKFFCPLWYKRL